MTEPGKFSFAVELPDGGPVIGFLGITSPPEIFYIFDEAHWGKGYATEALRAFLDAYWTRFPEGLPGVPTEIRDVLEAQVHEGNVASEGILAKCGFVHVGDGVTDAHGRNDVPQKIFRLERPA